MREERIVDGRWGDARGREMRSGIMGWELGKTWGAVHARAGCGFYTRPSMEQAVLVRSSYTPGQQYTSVHPYFSCTAPSRGRGVLHSPFAINAYGIMFAAWFRAGGFAERFAVRLELHRDESA